MYNHHIRAMADDVIKAGLVDESKKEELVAAMSIEWEDKIAPSWSVEDVIYRANEIGYTLTDEEAKQVLEEVDNRWDANVGICWDIFDIFIQDVVMEREEETDA